jgi:hypothetical protein
MHPLYPRAGAVGTKTLHQPFHSAARSNLSKYKLNCGKNHSLKQYTEALLKPPCQARENSNSQGSEVPPYPCSAKPDRDKALSTRHLLMGPLAQNHRNLRILIFWPPFFHVPLNYSLCECAQGSVSHDPKLCDTQTKIHAGFSLVVAFLQGLPYRN